MVDDGRGLRFAIIGAGMAGILSAIKLKEAGLTDFCGLREGGSVGGTWRENTYPGLSCDVPSHLYSYSFVSRPTGATVTRRAQIQAYFEQVARTRHHGRHPFRRRGHELPVRRRSVVHRDGRRAS